MKTIGIIFAIAMAGAISWFSYKSISDRHEIEREKNGEAVSKIIWSKMQSVNAVKVANLSGDIQGTAEYKGRLFTTQQKARFPFSVDYFVDFKNMDEGDLHWDEKMRKLYIDASDVIPSEPNIDESRRFAVETTGLYVSREAAEELSKRVSGDATEQARVGARTQANMADARERGVVALSKLFSMPLAAAGYGDVTVIVTFPPERPARNRDRWDVTTPLNEVLANTPPQR